MTGEAPAYDAFISYSHAADGRMAPALQQGLQRIGKPWYRRRALRVYRDKTGLSANPDLWGAIEDAMHRCRWFVLLASPAAAASRWVNQEVEHWRSRHGGDRILLVVTEGEWQWDDQSGDFDREASTAIPPALFGAFDREPLVVDVRWVREQTEFDDRHGAFRDAVADLAAAIRGMPKDDLVGEDIRQHRRSVRLASGAVVVLVVLALVASAAGVIATQNARRAEARRSEAFSRQLAASSRAEQGTRIDRSLLLAVEAWRERETPEARAALLDGLAAEERLAGVLWPDIEGAVRVLALTFSSDERYVAGAVRRYESALLGGERSEIPDDGFDRIVVWDTRSREVAWATELDDHALTMRFVADDVLLVKSEWSGPLRVDQQGVRPIGEGEFPSIVADGTRVLSLTQTGARLTDPDTGEALLDLPGASLVGECADRADQCGFLTAGGDLLVVDATTGEAVGSIEGPWAVADAGSTQVAHADDGTVVTVDAVRGVEVWHPSDGRFVGTNILAPEPTDGWASLRPVSISGDGSTLATNAGEQMAVWSTRTGRRLQLLDLPNTEFRFSEDGKRFVAAPSADGATLYDTATGEPLDREPRDSVLPTRRGPVADLVATVDFQNLSGLALWDLEHGRRMGVDYRAVTDVAWAPDAKFLLSVGDAFSYWDLRHELALPIDLTGHPGFVLEAVVSPEGRWFAAAGDGAGVTLWAPRRSVAPGRSVSRGPAGVVPSFDPVSGSVARVVGDEVVVGPLAEPSDRQIVLEVDPADYASSSLDSPGLELVLIPGGERLLVIDHEVAHLWEVDTGERLPDAVPCGSGLDDLVSVSAAADVLVSFESAGAEEVKACDAATGSLTARLPAPVMGNRFASGSAAVPAPGGERVAIGGSEGDVWIVDLDGTVLHRTRIGTGDEVFDAVRALAWTPDGGVVIAQTSGDLWLWHPLADADGSGNDGSEAVAAEPIVTSTTGADAVAVSPDGRFVAFGGVSFDFTEITVWDTEEGRAVGEPLASQLIDLHRLWWSADGTTLVGADSSGRMDTWNLDVEEWIEEACSIAGRTLDPDERARFLDDRTAETGCATQG